MQLYKLVQDLKTCVACCILQKCVSYYITYTCATAACTRSMLSWRYIHNESNTPLQRSMLAAGFKVGPQSCVQVPSTTSLMCKLLEGENIVVIPHILMLCHCSEFSWLFRQRTLVICTLGHSILYHAHVLWWC